MYQQGVVIRKKASGQDKSMYLLSKYSNVLLGSLNLNSTKITLQKLDIYAWGNVATKRFLLKYENLLISFYLIDVINKGIPCEKKRSTQFRKNQVGVCILKKCWNLQHFAGSFYQAWTIQFWRVFLPIYLQYNDNNKKVSRFSYLEIFIIVMMIVIIIVEITRLI